MNLEEFNIIIFITGIISGCLLTLAFKNLIAKKTKQTPKSNSELVSIKYLQQELDNKQVIIDNFISDSNEQLTSVEKRLANLRTTLSNNAKQLSNVVIEDNKTSKTDTPEPLDVAAPPKDYALKTDKEPGMLSESFGLTEKDSDIEPKRSI
ncbi:DUF1043 domain-containing protein [Marinomonas colpomeniae]|uniref:DUF1043 domain-containing protein n=1 Tax=Marinomonas colpomeniae TaxID=2774408 RepID=A0ABR8P087_9GAMM|nr:DUF1043 domain-containing protein [Marinomonas colpomeniae]MBD5771716.1 DUF1043 domain-containing protein [Marinomonas colpomeniae]